MPLRRAFFLLTACGLLAALALAAALWAGCWTLSSRYPSGGVIIGSSGVVMSLPEPTPEQLRSRAALDLIPLLGFVLLPAAGLAAAAALFYRWKLREPIELLLEGTRRIRAQDLDFTLPALSADELGQVCGAFETMRAELLRTNRALWQQAEERRRLNAAFAHDLRNPITVLKGSVKLLRQDPADRQALDRLEGYTARIEQYVEAMSSIQRLEQLPVRAGRVSCAVLGQELEETARLLAPALAVSVALPAAEDLRLDHGIFLTVAENLIGNAARYARRSLQIGLAVQGDTLALTVADDGPGFPAALLKDGPQPFGKREADGAHFGMGLYSSALLCVKHGGSLRLENAGGGSATAVFHLDGPF